MSGHVYLIPMYLSETNDGNYINSVVKSVIKNTTYYLVENVRTARRYISSLQLEVSIPDLHFETMDKNFDPRKLPEIFKPVLENGMDLGIISEAGLPGIADPGSLAVSYAHTKNIPVHPLPGSSSIILGLIASGFEGQKFTFHGYLPINNAERKKRLLELESEAKKSGYTQLFMETPYRNDQLFSEILKTLQPQTGLFIGVDITGESESCITKPVASWKKKPPKLHKIPAMFGINNLNLA